MLFTADHSIESQPHALVHLTLTRSNGKRGIRIVQARKQHRLGEATCQGHRSRELQAGVSPRDLLGTDGMLLTAEPHCPWAEDGRAEFLE